jgi:hypothetical protein
MGPASPPGGKRGNGNLEPFRVRRTGAKQEGGERDITRIILALDICVIFCVSLCVIYPPVCTYGCVCVYLLEGFAPLFFVF